jgi:plasmid stabilization system protein ParE
MSHEIRVRIRAQKDIESVARWYEAQRTELGGEFLDEVRSTFSLIAKNPKLYPEIHRQTRRAILQRFPFGVFYRIKGTVVSIIAVMHSSRDPKQWMTRT